MCTRQNQSETRAACLFQSLERRQLMTFIPTDMTQLAQHFQTHLGPTQLNLNFEGGAVNDDQAGGSRTIAAFAAQPGANRERAIQDIVYRVSEIFAPFNVQVRRRYGAGGYSTANGDTTIFIGAEASNVQTVGKSTVKTATAGTPWNSSDYPGSVKGLDHAPNSDDYDLAFVDPVGNYYGSNQTVWDNATIASAVAHEAGHTFGLAHVLSNPVKEVMSYDAGNSFFSNKTFTITSNNYDPSTGTVKPESKEVPQAWGYMDVFFAQVPVPSTIVTQNSFTTLSATLGQLNLNNDPYPHHVADNSTVDSSYRARAGAPQTLNLADSHSGFISLGGSDVFTIVNRKFFATQKLAITVKTPDKKLDPQILIYDSNGNTMLDAVHGSSRAFTLDPSTSYKVVIGGFVGRSFGNYSVSVDVPKLPLYDIVTRPIKLSDMFKVAKSSGFAATFSSAPIELTGVLQAKHTTLDLLLK
jgi:hypothetical protein